MDEKKNGYREVMHTADLCLEVWGSMLAELFENASVGMQALMGIEMDDTPGIPVPVELTGGDAEVLLVSFLSEILFLVEEEGLAVQGMTLRLDEEQLHGELRTGRISRIERKIKAVTYHGLVVQQGEDGLLRTQIVFDV